MVRFLKTMEEAKPSAFLVILMLACLFSLSTQNCTRPADLQDNVVIDPDQASYLLYNEPFTASCEAGFDVAGPTYFFCSSDFDGTPDYWYPDPSLTACNVAAQCARPNVDPDVIVTPDKTTYDTYENIDFTCSVEGYTIQGPDYARCGEDEVWLPENLPTCIEGCSTPSNTNGTGIYSHGENVMFSCNRGFKLDDGSPSRQAECDGGEWSPVIQCEEIKGCLAPPNQINVNYTLPKDDGGEYAIHSKLDMQCSGQRNAWGPLYSYCNETKQWEPDPLKIKCYDKCATPTFDDKRVTVTSLLSGSTNDAYYNHTDTVKFSCPGGIFVDGPWRASCKNGTWSTPIGGYRPVCRENCTAPDNTMNAGELFQHGQAHIFQCDPDIPGLVRLGGPRAFCNDGTWKPNLKCRLKTEL